MADREFFWNFLRWAYCRFKPCPIQNHNPSGPTTAVNVVKQFEFLLSPINPLLLNSFGSVMKLLIFFGSSKPLEDN